MNQEPGQAVRFEFQGYYTNRDPSRARHGDAIKTPESATIATKSGKVRRFIQGDTYIFKGAPFAAGTAGDNRFRPAQPVGPTRALP